MGQLYYTSAAAWVTQDSLLDEPWHITKKSSQCTFINKKKTQPAFTVMTRMLIKYWKEIIKWISKWYKAKAAVFSNTLTIGKLHWHWPERMDASSTVSLLKHAQSKAIVYSTSPVNCSWLQDWKHQMFESKGTASSPCHPFQIFQHTALTSSAMFLYNNLEKKSFINEEPQVKPTSSQRHYSTVLRMERETGTSCVALRPNVQQQQPAEWTTRCGGHSKGKL